jgi:hypothetical protein
MNRCPFMAMDVVWFRNDVIRDELAFLDRYLGPAK